MGYREAIAAALREDDEVQDWTAPSPARALRFVYSLTTSVNVPAAQAFTPIRRIGGSTGWYYANWLWRLRGFMDTLLGGPGLRPGRRDPEQLQVGDIVDCWRVEAYDPDRRLLLAALMKLPGRAWLEFRVEADGPNTVIRQTAVFDPRGVLGRLYWYASWPVHRIVFPGMLERIGRIARSGSPVVRQIR
jgi:hypothetical protein